MTIKFIPIKHNDEIVFGDLGLFGISGTSKFIGFKPGRPGKREGWLVVAVTGPVGDRPRKLKQKAKK